MGLPAGCSGPLADFCGPARVGRAVAGVEIALDAGAAKDVGLVVRSGADRTHEALPDAGGRFDGARGPAGGVALLACAQLQLVPSGVEIDG